MTKSELISELNKKLPLLQYIDVESAVNCMLEQMANAMVEGERVETRDFGSFSTHQRPSRLARNPKTGESVQLPEKTVMHFKPGKQMRDRVDAERNKCDIAD
ncbi:MAG: integration host factor subunit beta [Methylococcaceae bacterium]